MTEKNCKLEKGGSGHAEHRLFFRVVVTASKNVSEASTTAPNEGLHHLTAHDAVIYPPPGLAPAVSVMIPILFYYNIVNTVNF